jgi:hypothetical protein
VPPAEEAQAGDTRSSKDPIADSIPIDEVPGPALGVGLSTGSGVTWGVAVGGAASATVSPPPEPPVPADEPLGTVGGFGAGALELGAADVGGVLGGGALDGGVVVADSTGRLLGGALGGVDFGADVFVGLAGAGAGFGATARSRVCVAGGVPCGNWSLTNSLGGAGVVTVGSGIGLGWAREWSGSVSPSARSCSGSTALGLTGPPARLTLTSPP